jgi:hypothetical protein
MKELFLDAETIPTQIESFKDELVKPTIELYAAKESGLKAELEQIRPPANYKDPAKIADWEKTERPKKEEALRAQIAACQAECAAKVDEAYRRSSLDGALGQLVVIGFALDEGQPMAFYDPKEYLSLRAEARIIREFYQALEMVPEIDRHLLLWVGHNVIDFDLRFLYQRSVVHGIRPPRWIPFDAKPWSDRVYDTMLAWAGARGRVGQDKLCRVLGVDAKGSELGDEIDGSKVWDFVKAGRIEDVVTYNGGDVRRARDLYRRLTFQDVGAA